MSPPYDIISEQIQEELYQKHPNNFVRLILGKHFPTDTLDNNRYTRAKQLFDEWQQQSILIQSEHKEIYPYKITYTIENKQKVLNGFFVLLKLDPTYTQVKAHERTLSKPKEDRLNLMKACHANLEPIQLLYMDKTDTIQKMIDTVLTEPFIDVKGYDGFNHTIWKIKNKEIISNIEDELKKKILFIADGHHRYQTALNFAADNREKTGKNNADMPYNYRMVILANMFDDGLSILPTHRLIKKPGINLKNFIKKLQPYFKVEEKKINIQKNNDISLGKTIMSQIQTTDKHIFALYTKNHYYILTLKDGTIMDQLAPDRSKTWRTLDVSILHKVILEKIMGITESNIEDHVKYTRDDDVAIQFVDEDKYDLSYLMNATKIDELKAVAEAGEHMPQKSTYFLPKMLSGLVMCKM